MTDEKTIGELIQELITVDIDMWNNQEFLYELRRLTFNEYKNKYFSDENGAEKLWLILKKVCDLNIDRNNAMDKLDMKIIKIIEGKVPVQNT